MCSKNFTFYSVVFHTDDGKIFHGSGVGDPFGPRCYKGDIMGCGIMFPRDYILDSEGMDELAYRSELSSLLYTDVTLFFLFLSCCR